MIVLGKKRRAPSRSLSPLVVVVGGLLMLLVLHASSVCHRPCEDAVQAGVVTAYIIIPASSSSFLTRKRQITASHTTRVSNTPSFLRLSEKNQQVPSASASASEERIWDFQGHSCYAEIARPNPVSLLPTTKAEAAGRFFFGGEGMEVLKGLASSSSSTEGNEKTNAKKGGISGIVPKRPDVVLIHGFGCSTTYWRETCKSLTQAGYTVHALDLLGQGKSAKPGRADNVEYSINLWAQMVEEYTHKFIPKSKRIVLMGNSLGSVVALSAATGDHRSKMEDDDKQKLTLPSRIQGIGMFNCGVGMNSRNLLKDPNLNAFQRVLFTFLFDTLDKLIFDNIPFLTYLLEDVVTPDLLRKALLGLYRCSAEPEVRVDDALVDSFYLPAQDPGSVEALNQIYTNDAGKTPMQFHAEYADFFTKTPMHLVWGTEDRVTPFEGPVGQFYLDLVKNPQEPVTLSLLNAGHVPFDEIPGCNDLMVQWLEEVVIYNDPAAVGSKKETSNNGLLSWPSLFPPANKKNPVQAS